VRHNSLIGMFVKVCTSGRRKDVHV
jgi:hypothetical protein